MTNEDFWRDKKLEEDLEMDSIVKKLPDDPSQEEMDQILTDIESERKQQLENLHDKGKEALINNANPYPSFRPNQKETILEIVEAFEEGYETVILEAGTGVGKSIIGACVGACFPKAYYLTSNIQLQHQYRDDFEQFAVSKGRGNFECLVNHETCADGYCMNSKGRKSIDINCIVDKKKKCTMCNLDCKNLMKGDSVCDHKPRPLFAYDPFMEESGIVNYEVESGDIPCPYWKQKYEGIMNRNTIMNYHYFFPELNFIRQFTRRGLLVCDEGHNTAEVLVGIVGFNIDIGKVFKVTGDNEIHKKITKTKDSVIQWFKTLEFIVEHIGDYLAKEKYIDEKTDKFLKKVMGNCYEILDYIRIDKNLKKWIIQYDEKFMKLSVLPLDASRYSKEFLFRHASKVLIMSATVDREMTIKELGLNKDLTKFIELPSPFPAENCKIHTDYVGKFTGNPDNYLNDSLKYELERILKQHEGEKGIIHCSSYKVLDFVKDNVDNDRCMYHGEKIYKRGTNKFYRSKDKEIVLEKFMGTDDGVFVSPSSREGLDLDDEHVKFQIIIKMPYLDLGDRRIKKKANQDSRWYGYRTALNLIQTIGRGNRSADDTCVNYILDSSFERLIHQGVIPQYILDRCVDK